MKSRAPHTFSAVEADAAGILSWVHIGDLHMTTAGEQNHQDLQAIVREINAAFKPSIAFVFLPGDVAEKGDQAAYAVVRQALDELQAPCCVIMGDHDVHEKSQANFLAWMWPQTHYSFTSPDVRFLAMNAFDEPEPRSFAVLEAQLQWLHAQLAEATQAGQQKVMLLHCYPSDLKVGGTQVQALVRQYGVKLVEMGHTHYNEIANDGRTLYAATRSTGQIEEGPVGFSVTSLDGDVVSWKFFELGKLPAVMITSPSDERLLTDTSRGCVDADLLVRAKAWSDAEFVRVELQAGAAAVAMQQIPGSAAWESRLQTSALNAKEETIKVIATDAQGKVAEDVIRVCVGNRVLPKRAQRDQDNALGAWPEHGLLGTQLGPNKNGRKW